MIQTRPNALLIDITRCVGCGECVSGCLTAHGMKTDPAKVTGLSSEALTALAERDGMYVRQLCRHCVDPSCVSVCPVEAFKKTDLGPVVYEASRCMGCRYCMQACPFNVPKYQWYSANPEVVKCDMCASRQAEGKPTACTEACPAEATVFGKRDDLLAEAHRRIAENPGTYFPKVYGETEVGGTSVLFLSPVPFEKLGFRTDLPVNALPQLTEAALSKIPGILSIGGAALFGLYWLTHRKDEVARFEAAQHQATHPESTDAKH